MNEKVFIFILIFLLVCIIVMMIVFKTTTEIIYVLIAITSIITIAYFGHEIWTKENSSTGFFAHNKDNYYNKKPTLRELIQERNASEYIPDNIKPQTSYTDQTGLNVFKCNDDKNKCNENNCDDCDFNELQYMTYNDTSKSFYKPNVDLTDDPDESPTQRMQKQFEEYYVNDDTASIVNGNILNTDGNVKYPADIDFDNNYLKYYNEGFKETTENMTNSTYSPIGSYGGASNALDINDITMYQQRERNRRITDGEYQSFYGKRGEYLSRFYGPELDAYESAEWWGNYDR